MAMLLPLGIEKGKTFDPDARQKSILLRGAAMGELMARNLQINPALRGAILEERPWYKSFDFTIQQETDTRVELDERAPGSTRRWPAARAWSTRRSARVRCT